VTRHELIFKLLTTYHLNVPERAQLDPPTISPDEVCHAIDIALVDTPFFPPHARPVRNQTEVAGAIFDGALIEKASDGFFVHVQQSGPHGCAFRGHRQKLFPNLTKAVRFYLRQQYNGNIDGIAISKQRIPVIERIRNILRDPQDTLAAQARRLAIALEDIVKELEEFSREKPDFSLSREWLDQFRPIVSEFVHVVKTRGSREHAADLLTEMAPTLEKLSRAVYGYFELPIIKTDALKRCGELETIFREARNRYQQL